MPKGVPNKNTGEFKQKVVEYMFSHRETERQFGLPDKRVSILGTDLPYRRCRKVVHRAARAQ